MTFSHFFKSVYKNKKKPHNQFTFWRFWVTLQGMNKDYIELNISKVDSLITRKKEEKRANLLDAAYSCFINKGISGTSIAEICNKAGLAKGTFYLYFRDKEDIVRALMKKLSYKVLKNTYHSVAMNAGGFVENAVQMASELINYFEADPEVVQLMKKDFVWPINEEDFLTSQDKVMVNIRNDIDAFSKESGISSHQILVRIYALICMICSMCYSSIIDKFPADIEVVKPEIYSMIRYSLQPQKKA